MESTGKPDAISPFHPVTWNHNDVSNGCPRSQTLHFQNLRLRVTEYSPGYIDDLWCIRGHVLYVLDGEITTELKNGESATITAGMTYHVSEQISNHRTYSKTGARLFIIEGGTLMPGPRHSRGVWM